jgi:hypothetical protein
MFFGKIGISAPLVAAAMVFYEGTTILLLGGRMGGILKHD